MNYFEDFRVGDEWLFGTWSLAQEEALAFAREYDPQPIHTDPEMAAKTHFGGTIVSGWQTTLKCIRRFVDGVMKETAGLASPGIDEIRWLKPVKAGQEITAGARVVEIKSSASRQDRGLVWFEIFARDTEDVDVMTAKGVFFIARKSQP